MVVHHAVGISRQRNSGYRPSRVNIMAQGLHSRSLQSLSPTHLSIRRGRATTTHYTHHQVSLMVSRNTTLPSLELRIGPACEAGLSAGMRRERVPPQMRKKEKERSLSPRAIKRCKNIAEKFKSLPIAATTLQTDDVYRRTARAISRT